MQIVLFLLGLCYDSSTFLTAASVYISAFREVPAGECKLLVKLCAWVFFGSWLLFPLLFLMGPEGFGHLRYGHTPGRRTERPELRRQPGRGHHCVTSGRFADRQIWLCCACSPYGSIIAHTFADLLSKNLWSLLAHHLRNKVGDGARAAAVSFARGPHQPLVAVCEVCRPGQH